MRLVTTGGADVATDLRKAPPGQPERVTRSRGGAHAAGSRTVGRSAPPGRSPATRWSAAGGRSTARSRSAARGRSAAAALCAVAVVAVGVPLAILQIPDAIAW